MTRAMPSVSVLMPCYNEASYIEDALRSLADDYVMAKGEILVIDGMSTDGTQAIVLSLIDEGLPIRLLINEKRFLTFGLNLGITMAEGEIIVRADAHGVYPPRYVERCVDLLESSDAANVGGVMQPKGKSPVQEAVALALRHPLGVGDAAWRLGRSNGYVDTVYLGTFRKKLFAEIGLYDARAIANEDAELNLRILKAGKRIFLDNSLKVTYFPRATFKALARQFLNYGKGRCMTVLQHKKLTSPRQLAPVALLLLLILSVVPAFFSPLWLLAPAFYAVFLLAGALFSWPGKSISIKTRLLMAAAFATMHLAWGAGFLLWLIRRK